jgi:hypothetical protein
MDELKLQFKDFDEKAEQNLKRNSPISSVNIKTPKSQYCMTAPRQPQSMDPNYKLLARLAAAKCVQVAPG